MTTRTTTLPSPRPWRRHLSSLLVFALLGLARVAAAQDEPLLIELPPHTFPADVSESLTVVGSVEGAGSDPRFPNQAFYWMPITGLVLIGGYSAVAISRDGRTIAGRAQDEQGRQHAAIWLGGKEWRLLGSFSPDARDCDRLLSGTLGMNDDGSVLVGLGWNGCNFARAFRWEESTGMVDLGSTVPGRSSRANAVSDNGRIVVGWQDDATGFRQGAVWRDGVQEVVIGPFGAVGEAHATNSDGSLIVGRNCDPLELSAWTWREETGVVCHSVEAPPDPRSYVTMMLATSEDGRVIGGSRAFGPDGEAVLWLDGEPQYLKEHLRANGVSNAFSNWVNTGFITGVSKDGRVIVGQGAGPTAFQGYVVVHPPLN